MRLSYTLTRRWQSPEDLIGSDWGLSLPADKRMLIVSYGSLTLLLEALLKTRVEVEVEMNSRTELGSEAASFLGEKKSAESLEREVWLKAGGERLLYAHSLFVLSSTKEWLVDELTSTTKPLGRVLDERRIPILKEGLEVGFINSPELSLSLGLGADASLLARRYRILNKKSDEEWIVKAQICEVFGPSLVTV